MRQQSWRLQPITANTLCEDAWVAEQQERSRAFSEFRQNFVGPPEPPASHISRHRSRRMR